MSIREILEQYPDLREDLFTRGFLVTDRADLLTKDFLFYGAWHSHQMAGMNFHWHAKTGAHFFESDGLALFLFGHAYNPFTMQSDEQDLLAYLARSWEHDFEERLNELSGIFVLGVIANDALYFVTDTAGLQSACCGVADGHFYLSSHAQMIGDLCDLQMSEYVKELTAYKWYGRVMGPYLPADLTMFENVKRVVPNQLYTYRDARVTHKRFYPVRELVMHTSPAQYEKAMVQAAQILRRSMLLVCKKWDKVHISLTGGVDSGTTFAAANGLYDQIEAFSYLASEKERADCNAAKRISARFDVPWTLYTVPQDNGEVALFAERKALLLHNNGYVANTPDHELRKRMVLKEQFFGSVEVKSWVSEITRGYWYKYYGQKRMPALSARLYRNLYKIFICNRSLAKRTDQVFEQYLQDYEYAQIPAQYLPADLHYWEIGCGSWAGLNISEMKYYADITVIYNNRKFLDLMLGVPFEKRVSDQHHSDMKRILNKDLSDMGIHVVNAKETKTRARLLGLLFALNSHLPF